MLGEIKQAIKSISNTHHPNGSPNIFLFSMPRSGTTWLMELIWSQPGFKFCIEPLNIRNPAVRQHLGITDWQDLYSREANPALKNYIQAFCDGQLRFKNPNPFTKYYRPYTHAIIFKVLNGAEDRINWFRDTFNGRIIYLLRHPIAVSISRKEFPRLQAFLSSDYRHHLTSKQLEYAKKILASGTKLERGVLSWCLQNTVPLRQATDDWAIISYEQLVLEPHSVIEYLVQKLKLPKPERMMARLTVPSAVKRMSDRKTQLFLEKGEANNRAWLVEKWREKVSQTEERAAMEILERFELDVYRFGYFLPSEFLLVK